MAEELAQNGVIRYSLAIPAGPRAASRQAAAGGRISVRARRLAFDIFNRIARGDVFFYELMVPEGSNIFDIAANVGRFDFLKAVATSCAPPAIPSLIRDLAPRRPRSKATCSPPLIASRAPPPSSSFAR